MKKRFKKNLSRRNMADKFNLSNTASVSRASRKNEPDYVLMAIIFIIVLFGLAALSSASSVFSFNNFDNTYKIVLHQILFGLLPGLVLFFIFFKIDYRYWLKFNFLWLVASISMLFLVFIPGIGSNLGTAAQSWVKIFGFSFHNSSSFKPI